MVNCYCVFTTLWRVNVHQKIQWIMGGVENEYIYIMVLAAFDESLNDGKML